MNEYQITALACEYAEAENQIESYGDNIVERRMDLSLSRDEAERVLRWLSLRFCLVEKSNLEDKYKSSKHYFEHTDNSNPTQKQYFWGRICAIESLFPEIAKEVEE